MRTVTATGDGRRNTVLSPAQLTGRAHSHVMRFDAMGCSLHPQAAAALLALRTAAARANIDLAAASAFRDFARQRDIWNGKYRGERPLLDRAGQPIDAHSLSAAARIDAILHWSALPGASRHHWGTDFDVVDLAALPPGTGVQQLLLPGEYAPGGRFERLQAWLLRHGEEYGFYRPYDRDRGGVQPEPWHLSFAPLAADALAALTVDVLGQALEDAALEGVTLEGTEVVQQRLVEIHARYVCAVATPSATALAAPALAVAA